MQRVRVEIDGDGAWGRLQGAQVITDDGRELAADGVRWLAPVAPSKIIAVHLTYRSRLLEYAVARMPAQPSYFMKPPSTLNGPAERASAIACWSRSEAAASPAW